MPASARSIHLTDAYRRRLVETATRAQARAVEFWPRIEDLDETDWPDRAAAVVARAQTEAVRATSGYLTAYIGSEKGQRTRLTPIPTGPYVGVSRDGRPLSEALRGPIIGVLAALKDGRSSSEALALGLVRAKRTVSFETVQTGRDALLSAIDADPRTSGHQRDVAGTCAACMALSGTAGPRFEVHPGCECVPQPMVGEKDVPVNLVGEAGALVRGGLEQVRVHRWPDKYEPIPVRLTDGPDEFINKGIFPKEIRLRRGESAVETNTSFTHEMGHYLDMLMVDRTDLDRLGQKFLSTRPTEEMSAVLKEARGTDTMKRIRRDFPGDAKELNRNGEIWARAYAQWRGFPETRPEWAWSKDEFQPIGRAVERVLRKAGLL